MKKTIILVHGWGGSPNDDWIGWSADAFRQKGFDVIAPEMPDTDSPVIEKWVKHLGSVVGTVDDNTYFIGHSIGCQTIMRFLERAGARVAGAIFVAGWFSLTNQSEEEMLIAKPWLETPIEYAKVSTNLAQSVAILSDNDPYVPYEESKVSFEAQLGSEVVTIRDAGHFTSNDGFGPFPQLIEIFNTHFAE